MRHGKSIWMRGGCAIALAGTTAASAAAAVISHSTPPAPSQPAHADSVRNTAHNAPDIIQAIRATVGAVASIHDTLPRAPRHSLMAMAADAAGGLNGWRDAELAQRAAHRGMRPTTWNGTEPYAAEVKYHEDFEGRTLGKEWSIAQITSMSGMSRFAGPFRNQASSVHVAVTEGQSYIMSIDICFVATRLGTPDASDLIRITVDGQVRFEHHIARLVAEHQANRQANPELNPHVYPNLLVPFRADYPIAEIVIEGVAAGDPGGEMWGFDNVIIDTTPKLMASLFGEQGANRAAASGGGGGGASPGAPLASGRSFGPGGFSPGPSATSDPDRSPPRFPFIDSNPYVEEPRLPLQDPITPDFDPYTPSQPSDPPSPTPPPTDDEPPIDRSVPPDVPTPGVLMVAPIALAMGLRRRR